jgi:hypothetical protein
MGAGEVRLLWHRFEGGGAELVQEAVAAPGDLAHDRQRRAGVGQAAGFERVVVGIVGALQPGGGLPAS